MSDTGDQHHTKPDPIETARLAYFTPPRPARRPWHWKHPNREDSFAACASLLLASMTWLYGGLGAVAFGPAGAACMGVALAVATVLSAVIALCERETSNTFPAISLLMIGLYVLAGWTLIKIGLAN